MKDISASAGKPPDTVRRWVSKAGFKKKGDDWRHVSEARANRIVSALLEDEGQSDYEQYRMLQDKMRQMGASKMGTPEFRQLWQQSEAIKNRNGGMPPQPPTAPPKASFAPNPGYAA